MAADVGLFELVPLLYGLPSGMQAAETCSVCVEREANCPCGNNDVCSGGTCGEMAEWSKALV